MPVTNGGPLNPAAEIHSPGADHRSTPIVGESPVLKRQLEALKQFSRADAPIHVYGETGTGKELVARTIHDLSARAGRRFIAQNCAAIPDTLLQSLLFGHRRGTFTGADRDQIGVFEAADGGTLFLDEVADLSPAVQGALLRVLEAHEVTRLGEIQSRRIDIRLVSASNKVLEDEVKLGRFRSDLYFRMVTLRVHLPPLSERRSDVPLLVDHFIRAYNARTGKGIRGIEPCALTALKEHQWPGNIRQLQAEVERACILVPPGGAVTIASLSPEVRGDRRVDFQEPGRPSRVDGRSLPIILADVEKLLLQEALTQANGNKTKAAHLLGISRQRFCQRLQRWRL